MSALAPARAPARSTHSGARPSLRLVAAPRIAAGPLPFALVVAGVLGAGLVALLMLHTLAAQDAFAVHKLTRQSAALGDVEQQLAVANEQAQAPYALAARARSLGMVPTGALRVIRRRNGTVVAVATAVPVPVPAASPSPAPSASSTPTPGGASKAAPGTAGGSKTPKHPAGPRRPR